MYIVQKHELKRIGPLGSGAFGTVYKGVWCPENDPKVQLPVAIKVLQDPVPGAEQTFIDVSYVKINKEIACRSWSGTQQWSLKHIMLYVKSSVLRRTSLL